MKLNDINNPVFLNLLIRTPEEVLFNDDVLALTTVNVKGVFDILPYHANFITLVKDILKINLKDGTFKEMKIEGGVLRVFENKVQVFLGL